MKKMGFILCLSACTSAIYAQSNVSISGAIDLAVRSVDNGVLRQTLMVRDGVNSSKLRFIGNEDLGGGLKANFWLDMPVRADDGTGASVFWDRRSTVSLISSWGELRLGRDAALQNSGPGDFDAFNGKGVGNVMNLATPRNFSNATTFTRVSNAVSYLLPDSLGGVYGQVQLAPSEGVAGARHSAYALGYKNGSVETRLTYGRTGVDSVATVNPITGASTVVSAAGAFSYAVLGGSYDWGSVKLLGSVTRWQSAEAAMGSRKQLTYNIGALVPLGYGSLNFAFTDANRSGLGSDAQDARQFAVQYIYNLSKRTAVYMSASRIQQDVLATASNAQYNMDGTNLVGRTGKGFDFGIRLNF